MEPVHHVLLRLLFVYVVRVNFSVAIICMVRVPTRNVTSGSLVSQSYSNVSHHRMSLPVARNTYPGNETTHGYIHQLSETSDTEEAEISDESSCSTESEDPSAHSKEGEFDWDKPTQTRLLAMYFYGYIFTQVPGGWLAGRIGGRRVWGVCQTISALCSLATPLAARTNVYIVYAIRFILGLAAGVSFPCIHAMMGRWAPTLERSKLVSFSFTGMSVGTVLTFSLSALLCVSGFDNGWGSIFYLSGAGNLLWVVVWLLVTSDTPAKHKRIKEIEKNYIMKSIGESPESKARIPTPWRAMITSGPVWAIVSAHVLHNYTNYTMLTSLPTFMKEVLKFDTRQNGALSAVPYLSQAVVSALSGQVADRLRERASSAPRTPGSSSRSPVAFVGSAVCMALAGYMTCSQRPLAVFLLSLCLSFMGLNRSGFGVNHIDLAPRHAGVLYGLTNTVATVPGMIAPLIAGALTPNRTAEEWRRVFFVCAALAVLGAILYGVLADGELQTWAVPPSEELKVAGPRTNTNENNEDLLLSPFTADDATQRRINSEDIKSPGLEKLNQGSLSQTGGDKQP
ncbi:hypothetical protein C0Q70_03700 [Pomacea canaliculata]|uniref:Major facilitator superfamily (MFS) profile domain-containing protein n=1 Tax=Pomacea canaliculata TaxID=400727 RepID=A0A2T7PTG7_POMCA|nr:hypothetical protein C0Q70_03700 [Pomacea canaliculata]